MNDQRDRASLYFQNGCEFMEIKNFEDAIIEFELSIKFRPSYDAYQKIYECKINLGHYNNNNHGRIVVIPKLIHYKIKKFDKFSPYFRDLLEGIQFCEELISNIENYLNTAKKFKTNEQKINFFDENLDTFSIAEGEPNQFKNELFDFCMEQKFSDDESNAFWYCHHSYKLNLEMKDKVNKFKIKAFDICVKYKLPQAIQLLKDNIQDMLFDLHFPNKIPE